MQPHLRPKLEHWPPFRLDVVPPADSHRREQAPCSGVSIPPRTREWTAGSWSRRSGVISKRL
jgi:hypothetical protein